MVMVRKEYVDIFTIFADNETVCSFSVGLHFHFIAVDPRGRIWASPARPEIWCFTEDGRIVGIKKFSKKTTIEFMGFRGDELVLVEEGFFSGHEHNYRISFYTTKFEDETPMTPIYTCHTQPIRDFKVCNRTGIMYILLGDQIYSISTDNNTQLYKLDSYTSNIRHIAVTANGDVLLCNAQDQISLCTLTEGRIFHNIMSVSVRDTFAVTSMFSLPNQQVAVVSAYSCPPSITVLDV